MTNTSSIHRSTLPFSWPRKFLALVAVVVSGGVILAAFWYQDWRYSLPTPKPAGWHSIALGSRIELPALLQASGSQASRPLFLHFFSPDCPCSQFNLDHVRSLIRNHGGTARFAAVLQGGDASKLRRQFDSLNLGIVGVPDVDGRIAAACGVYSTPQAVILDSERQLVFRGNYNLGRYCTASSTEFARIALEATEAGKPVPAFPEPAFIAYGCELPGSR